MPDLVANRRDGIYEGLLRSGMRLADTPEADGGWAEYFQENDYADLRMEDDVLRSQTALLLENCKQWLVDVCHGRVGGDGMVRLNETTRSALVGGFSDYLFPIIRAAFPTNPINDLISVQPTNRKVATIMFWNYMIGTTKGGYVRGQRIFDANVGRTDSGFSYTSENIPNEAVSGVRTGSNGTYTGTLQYADGGGIRANTVEVTIPLVTLAANGNFFDNGNGGWTTTAAGTTVAGGSINYTTGAFSIVITGDTFGSNAGVANYSWDSEGSCNLPEMDINITSSTAETERRAIKVNYTIEAMQDIMAELGVALEPNLISAAAEQMNYEIARQIIHQIWMAAPIVSTFPITGPVYISQQQYFGDIVYYINKASNSIWQRTQKAYANWVVVDAGAASLLQSLPNNLFQAAPAPASVQGLHYVGVLMGTIRVYKDLLLSNEPGASTYGNLLFGYKGTDFFSAGFVWAPYQMLYTTDSIPTPCFTVAKGMATRYASKLINPYFFCKMTLGA